MNRRNVFFISDTHFFHANILKFKDEKGDPIRDFDSVEEMNETMVDNWNEIVRPQDKVYHLGDVTFHYGKTFRELWSRLNGHKRLLLGNHDRLDGTILHQCFERTMVWRMFPEHNFVCSHIPIHLNADSNGKKTAKYDFNVHGHIHTKTMDDPRYINICVEQTAYRPIHLDEIATMIDNKSKLEAA